MAGNWLPPTTPRERPPSVTDYVGAYLKGVELRRRSDADETQQALANVQLQRANQQQADEATSRAVVPLALGGPPKTTEISPAVPATPGTPAVPATPGTGQSISDFVDPGDAAGYQPAQTTPGTPAQPAVPGTPGRPAVMESAHTLSSVAQNVGGAQNLAAMMRTASGRQAMQTLRVVDDDTFQKHETALRSRDTFERSNEAARAARASGDELKAIDHEIAAWSSIATAADHNGAAVKRLHDLSLERQKLSKDTTQRALADADAKTISSAIELWENDPSPTTLGGVLSAYTNAKSEQYTKNRDRFIADFQKESSRMIRQGRLSRGMGDIFGKVMVEASAAREQGRPIDFITATRKVMADNPQQGAAIVQELMLGNPKDVSPFWQKVIFGDEKTAHNPTIQQQAYNMTLGAPSPTTGEPLEEGTPEFNQVWNDNITKLTRDRQRPLAPRGAGGKSDDDKRADALFKDITNAKTQLTSIEATLRTTTLKKADRAAYEQKKADLESQIQNARGELVKLGRLPESTKRPGNMPGVDAAGRRKLDPGTQEAIRETTVMVLKERFAANPQVQALTGPDDTNLRGVLEAMSPQDREALRSEVQARLPKP